MIAALPVVVSVCVFECVCVCVCVCACVCVCEKGVFSINFFEFAVMTCGVTLQPSANCDIVTLCIKSMFLCLL